MKSLIINNQLTTYQIDKSGQIYNTITKKFLQGTIRNGYKMVKLTIKGQKKDYLVHRLVAQTFIENSNNLPIVNHIDGNKLNNQVSNLEWVNQSQNVQHAIDNLTKGKRQKILPIQESIDEKRGWKQYKDTNYWFNKDGRGANVKTKKYLNLSIKNSGYGIYYLYINKTRIGILGHRIIYELFKEPIEPNMQINHIDGNKLNNNINNLEQITRSENILHAYYDLKHKVKPVIQYSLSGNFIKEYPSINEAARINHYNDSGIIQACKGKIKTYKNFIWKYKEE